jgi:putative peptidoglycan lipid II flippase
MKASPAAPVASGLGGRDSAAHVAVAMLTVAVYLGLGKAAGALREVAVAWRHGVGPTLDAYVFVSGLYAWLPSLAFTVLSAVLVPIIAVRDGSAPAQRRFLGELLSACLLLGAVFTLAAWFAAAGLAAIARPDDPAVASQVEPVARSLAPALLLGVAIAPASVLLLGQGRHVNTLFEGLPALAVLIAVLAWAGTGALVWGLLAGMALQLGALVAALVRTGGMPRPVLGLSAYEWHAFGRALGVMAAGQALMSLVTVVDQFVAMRLGEGQLSTFGYANRTLALATGLGGTVVARAVLPATASLMAAGRTAQAVELARTWSIRVLGAGMLAASVAWVLAPPTVDLLFVRGAFGQDEATAVTEVLRWGLLQLPFYFAGVVLVQLLASQRRYRAIAAVAAANLVVKLAANAVLVPWLGAAGLMAATAAMYLFSATALWRLSRRTAP